MSIERQWHVLREVEQSGSSLDVVSRGRGFKSPLPHLLLNNEACMVRLQPTMGESKDQLTMEVTNEYNV